MTSLPDRRAQRARPRARRREGITLVEAAVVVCVVGIVLAVFIPTFVRELRTSKTSEAVEHLSILSDRAAAYFATEFPQEEGPTLRRCLPPTAGPTPRAPTVDPAPVRFDAEETPGHATWQALGFSPRYDVRYAYTFEPTSSGCGLRSPEGSYLLTLRAEGDLDDDGERSLFERRMAADEHGVLHSFGILYIRDRVE
ncbi:MAG: hypothetical protein AB7S26_28870 [Sandaracinaceae bacterium]